MRTSARVYTRAPALILAVSTALTTCDTKPAARLEATWTTQTDRTWVGPGFWANRLQDWRVKDGRLECVGTGPMRTVHLLTRRLGAHDGDFSVSVVLGRMELPGEDLQTASAGLLIGAGPTLDYRAAALIHHSHGPSAGLYAGIDSDGRLFLRDFEPDPASDEARLAESEATLAGSDSLILRVEASPGPEGYSVELTATDAADSDRQADLHVAGVDPARLIGNLALAANPTEGAGQRLWFRSITIDGEKLEVHKDRTAGPIIGSQHTLSRGTLALTAQAMPIGAADSQYVDLQLREGSAWTTVARAPILIPGYTATFRVEDWNDSRDTPYRLAYTGRSADGSPRVYYIEGNVPRDPIEKPEIVVAAFTGNHNAAHPGVDRGTFPWNRGLWFPHRDIVRHVYAHQPDFLFFSGDQVYEGASPTRADLAHPYEDYLYKWYLWYWAFGELTANMPSVTIPDDHDVYHGNIWGAGGIATPPGLSGAAAQDAGGYKLPADWVNMVQRTQTSHLPDPFDPEPVQQGIEVYYTDILYGGVSFAVIEDRKFKSAPAPLLPTAEIWNGWPQNPSFDPRTEADVTGATLLDDRQLIFLEQWAADWSGNAWMKVLLSQTLFANLATLPDSATSGAVIPSLEILPPGEYAPNEKVVSDLDSNGWPQSGRDAAVRAVRKGFAVHLAGDQHLASTIQYGIDDWGDAGYALCVPSIANFWPRRWFPPRPGANRDRTAPAYTGDYEDGFGNKMTVRAVANPHRYGKEPAELHDRAPGYGIARFDRPNRTISLAAWPRWADPIRGDRPYAGWPILFRQTDNYGRAATAYLPVLAITGMADPVVQIVKESSAEVVYTLRINGTRFTPRVFAPGLYTLHVGELGTSSMRTFTGLLAAEEPRDTLRVTF